MQRFWQGEIVRVSIAFTDADGVPMPATGVTLNAKGPDGVLRSVPVAAGQAAGEYIGDIEATMAGTWGVRATCAGPTVAVSEERFEVAGSLVV